MTDLSAAFGVSWQLGDWNMDSSLRRVGKRLAFTPASRTPTVTVAPVCRTAIPLSLAPGIPGFRPENEVDEDRTAVGAYIDLETNAEESLNYSVGAVARIGALTLTLDTYRIDIDNRIVLSENLTSADVVNYLTRLGFVGIGGGRFLINGVDTTTEGLDLVLSYPLSSEPTRALRFHPDRQLQLHRCHQGDDYTGAVGVTHSGTVHASTY